MVNYAVHDMSVQIDAVLSRVKYEKIRDDPVGSAVTISIDLMKPQSKTVSEKVYIDTEQAISFIDKLVEKLGESCKILREHMIVIRDEWARHQRGDFSKSETEFALLAIDVRQNQVVMKRTTITISFSKSNKLYRLVQF